MTETPLGPLDLQGTGTIAVGGTGSSQFIRWESRSRSRLNLRLNDPSMVNPIDGTSPYRVIVVDMYGKRYAELQNAELSPVKWSINEKGSFTFRVPVNDPKAIEVQVPEREVQVWRGSRLLWWGVIVRARANDQTLECQCQTLEWYFDRRLVGPIPRRGVFETSVGFEYGVWHWKKNVLPNTQPRHLPVTSLSSDFSITGSTSMVVSASGGIERKPRSADAWFTTVVGSVLTNEAKNQIQGMVNETLGDNPRINVRVWHDNRPDWKTANKITDDRAQAIADHILTIKPGAIVVTTGYGSKDPIASNRTWAGKTANRRIEISYRNTESKKGHGQFVSRKHEIRWPRSQPHRLKVTFRAWVYISEFNGPAAHNYGVVLERQDPSKPHKNPKLAAEGFKKVYSRAFVPINRETPRSRWVRMEASVMVPNDGKKYVLESKLFPPHGTAYFDEADLYLDEALDYVNEEQADIFRDLVDHAQSVEMGKADLNIRKKIRNTGVRRTRRYYFSERTVIGDHLNEFTTLGDGMEWDIVITPVNRTITTYFPRKERRNGYVLRLGYNVLSADVDVDALQTSNVVVVMANDVEAMAREERAAKDLSLMDGQVMEIAYMATPGSSISSLMAQAQRGLERYRKPTVIPTVNGNPRFTEELLQHVQTGDVVTVDVREGWFQTMTEYRVLDMTLDPSTEIISFVLMPEDAPIVVLSDWEDIWKYRNLPQQLSTGMQNTSPKETHKEYAGRDYDDSGWSLGQAGFGWFQEGNFVSRTPSLEPKTTIPVGNEVWMRKTVKCTEEMYVSVKVDQWAYVYVNGHLVRDRPLQGQNFENRFMSPSIRVPQEYLDPSGEQVVTMHVQDRMADMPEKAAALYADLKVRGVYNPNHARP